MPLSGTIVKGLSTFCLNEEEDVLACYENYPSIGYVTVVCPRKDVQLDAEPSKTTIEKGDRILRIGELDANSFTTSVAARQFVYKVHKKCDVIVLQKPKTLHIYAMLMHKAIRDENEPYADIDIVLQYPISRRKPHTPNTSLRRYEQVKMLQYIKIHHVGRK